MNREASRKQIPISFVPIAEAYDLLQWKSLYELAKLFDVTISALCVRLAHLGLSYVDEQGRLHGAGNHAAAYQW